MYANINLSKLNASQRREYVLLEHGMAERAKRFAHIRLTRIYVALLIL